MQYIPFLCLLAPLSALWVYHDAVKNKLGKQPYFTMTPFIWGFCTLLCWPVFLGLYLVRRGALVQKAIEHPQSFETALGAKFAFFILFAVMPLAVLIAFKVAGPSVVRSASAALQNSLGEQFADELDEKYPPEEDEIETAFDSSPLAVNEEPFHDTAMPLEEDIPLPHAFRTENIDLSMGLPRNIPAISPGQITEQIKTLDLLDMFITLDLERSGVCKQLDLFEGTDGNYIGFAQMADGTFKRIKVTSTETGYSWTVSDGSRKR